jgi:hypothetical protein
MPPGPNSPELENPPLLGGARRVFGKLYEGGYAVSGFLAEVWGRHVSSQT